ncbi:winged helix-turn-helix transcriptional regulator [Planctomycetota bacterium]|nr:winged helix-turn-helix transcriptional regulator [Planctomycetota bacterium]
MDQSIQIKAIASDTRMHILKLLANPKKHFKHQWSADPVDFGVCMTLIAEALQIAQPTASRHLEILKQAGFITVRKHQKWSYCKRNDKTIQAFTTWLTKQLTSK